jgi:hypothetical protein
MNWTFPIKGKWRAALVFTLVLTLMLSKNLADNKRSEELNTTFNSVYEDRLVVEHYIYKLTTLLYENRLMLDGCMDQSDLQVLKQKIRGNNAQINGILTKYEATQLTEREAAVFEMLKYDIVAIEIFENELIGNIQHTSLSEIPVVPMSTSFLAAGMHLSELSNIQMAIGRDLRDNSRQMIAGGAMLSKMEIAILILMGLFVHILLFSDRLTNARKPVNYHLN